MKTITRMIKRLEELRKQGYDCDEECETLQQGAVGMNLYIYKPAKDDILPDNLDSNK